MGRFAIREQVFYEKGRRLSMGAASERRWGERERREPGEWGCVRAYVQHRGRGRGGGWERGRQRGMSVVGARNGQRISMESL